MNDLYLYQVSGGDKDFYIGFDEIDAGGTDLGGGEDGWWNQGVSSVQIWISV